MKHLPRCLLALLALTTFGQSNVPITGLPAISSVTSSTVLPVVDVSGTPTTKKATAGQLIDGLPDVTNSTRGVSTAADHLALSNATNANTASTLVKRDASGNFSAGTITAAGVTGLASPTNPTDAANKSYVDAAAAGLVIKSPVSAATVGSNITLTAGTPTTLDGVALSVNFRILVKDQTDNKENGLYYVTTLGSGSNGTWTRSTDADTGAELVTGSYTFITGGTVNANASYTMVTPGTITIGTSPIVWNLFSQVTQILASNILGQIVGAQIQDAAINTAKFAASITPVEIASTLPTTGNFAGRQVFLTTDSQVYRYNGSAFTNLVPAVNLSGTITSTQIADNSISTPKLQANSITATNILAGAVSAGKIAANAVTAGTIAAAAVSATEISSGAITTAKLFAGAVDTAALAANAVTAAKIQAGTITADKLTVSDLSAISANIGTITNGSLTSSASITVGSGTAATSITSGSGLQVAGGRIALNGDGANPAMLVNGTGSFVAQYLNINAGNGSVPPFFQAVGSGGYGVSISYGGIALGNSKPILFDTNSYLQKASNDTWTPKMYDGSHTIEFQFDGTDLKVRIDGSTVKTVDTH